MDATSNASTAIQSHVLYEPEMYRPPADEAMIEEEDDAHSVSTHAGVNASMISSYKTGLDPALFAANRM